MDEETKKALEVINTTLKTQGETQATIAESLKTIQGGQTTITERLDTSDGNYKTLEEKVGKGGAGDDDAAAEKARKDKEEADAAVAAKAKADKDDPTKFDINEDPAFKAMKEELDGFKTGFAEMKTSRDEAVKKSSAQELDRQIDSAAEKNGMSDKEAREDFVEAKRNRFRLDEDGEVGIFNGDKQVRSKEDPTKFMGQKEFFNGLKTTASHWFPTTKKHGKTFKAGAGDSDDDDAENAPRIITDPKELFELQSTLAGRKQIKEKEVVFKSTAAG